MRKILQLWKQYGGYGTMVSTNDQDIMTVIEIAIKSMPKDKIGIIAQSHKYFMYKNKFPENTIDNRSLYAHDASATQYMILFVIGVDSFKYTMNNAVQRLNAKYRFYTAAKYEDVPQYVSDTSKVMEHESSTYNEYNYIIPMSDDVKVLYDKIIERMSDVMGVFRDYDNINGCIAGADGKDPLTFRNDFANDNGWSRELDMTIPMFRDIDKFYNPDNLFEQANLYNTMVRERSNIICKSSDKVDFTIAVAAANSYKQIVITAKGDDMCDTIAHKLQGKGIKAESVHANTKSAYMYEDGEVIKYKSGAKKGEPKPFGTTVMNRHYLKLFEQGKIKVIVTTGTIDRKSEIKGCELMIVTSAKSANYFRVKSRINTFEFKGDINCVNVVYDIDKDLKVFESNQESFNVDAIEVLELKDVIF